ncbi:MAG: hypothetical protein HC802_01885 [Caldilineaceae bacterium]|nr:hypothetical protein [Caldilineaceae bacterium]
MASANQAELEGARAPSNSTSSTIASWLFRLAGLALVDAVAIYLVYNMFNDGIWLLGAVIGTVTILINVIFLREDLFPLRWISPGLALLIVMVLYPIFSTIYTSFTNFGDGHLLTKPVAIRQLEKVTYLEEGASSYVWTAYVGRPVITSCGWKRPRVVRHCLYASARSQPLLRGRRPILSKAIVGSTTLSASNTPPHLSAWNLASRPMPSG